MVMAEAIERPRIEATVSDYSKGSHKAYALGADLGQSIDPTAISLIERDVYETGKIEQVQGLHYGATNSRRQLAVRFSLRALERLPLGTKYQSIAAILGERHALASEHGETTLLFDETGNRAGGDNIRAVVPSAIGCTLTASERDQRGDGRRWSISKANMVTGLLAAIESGDLIAAADLRDFDAFKAHLVDLRRRISTLGHMSFNAREGAHDDYVTSTGLAWWWARHQLNRCGARTIRLTGH